MKGDWSDVELRDLIQATLGPFLPNTQLTLRLGANAPAPRAAVAALSMALYELATNSLKYGALANAEGIVHLETRQQEDRVSVAWREIGLAHVALGESAGLGAALIRGALSGVDGGAVHYTIGPESVSCVFEWPLRSSASPTGRSDDSQDP